MKTLFKPHSLAIFSAAFLWAVGGVFFIPKLYHLDVNLVVLIQHILPSIIFTIGFLIWKRDVFSEIKNVSKTDWITFLSVAFFGGYLGTYAITQAFFTAYSTGESLSTIFFFQKLQPIFAVLLAVILLKESLSKKFWEVAILAIIGSYLLTFGINFPEISLSNTALVVSGWAALAAFSWGASTTISKKALTNVSFEAGTYLRFLLTGAIVMVIIGIFGMDSEKISVSIADWKIFGYIAITTGGLALWLYYWGLKHITASNSAIYEMAMPVFALTLEQFVAPHILDGFVAPEISGSQILGGLILVFAGLWLAKK